MTRVAFGLKKRRVKRSGEEMCTLGITIPFKLRERMELEAPVTNWSALISRMIEIELDKCPTVQQSLTLRIVELENRVRLLEEKKC